ncbi:MAG: hypothetical protein L3J59_08160 [Methylococcaceae bacterium]|nr:hypothetical protein [Methylococcaceae bacterium]
MSVTESNLQQASDYLQKQFNLKSWWPKAQPGLAKREFLLMNGSAIALNVWCERWLDAGQYRKLDKAIKRAT